MQREQELENERQQPFRWLVWHPHQKLWNRRLLRMVERYSPTHAVGRVLRGLIIYVDTLFLALRATTERMKGLPAIIKNREDGRQAVPSVVYIDIGTHKRGEELQCMIFDILPSIWREFFAYGIEAGEAEFQAASRHFGNAPNVEIIHGAVCCTVPEDGKVRLYLDNKDGRSNSMYRTEGAYQEVRAFRLSQWFREKGIDPTECVLLIRMNIEGAEMDVIEDLVDVGVAQHVDGWFGMWDDVSKIDLGRDDEFRSVLRENGIRPFPFNARDLDRPLRRKLIALHVRTCVFASQKRASSEPVRPD